MEQSESTRQSAPVSSQFAGRDRVLFVQSSTIRTAHFLLVKFLARSSGEYLLVEAVDGPRLARRTMRDYTCDFTHVLRTRAHSTAPLSRRRRSSRHVLDGDLVVKSPRAPTPLFSACPVAWRGFDSRAGLPTRCVSDMPSGVGVLCIQHTHERRHQRRSPLRHRDATERAEPQKILLSTREPTKFAPLN